MKILAVIAHPNPQSFNHALLEEFRKGLAEAGHELEVLDLYKENFNPLFGFEDFGPYMGKPLPGDVTAMQERVGKAEAFAFFFPVWWSGPPAMFKGWFDRIFTRGFAFNFGGESGFQGILPQKKAIFVNTAMGPEEAFSTGVKDAMTKILVDEGMKICGVQDVDYHILTGVMESDEVRKDYLSKVYGLGKGF